MTISNQAYSFTEKTGR